MKNQVLEFNLGSIEKIRIFGDLIEFFFKPIAQVRGQIKDNWKFNDQLKDKLHKSEIKDRKGKGAQNQG